MRERTMNDLLQYYRLIQPDSRELAGSHNVYDFTAFALDRQDRLIRQKVFVQCAVIDFSQFFVAISTSDRFHCAYPVIALHRCLDGTVTRLNAGMICGKWLSRMRTHPGRSHRFSYCFCIFSVSSNALTVALCLAAHSPYIPITSTIQPVSSS